MHELLLAQIPEEAPDLVAADVKAYLRNQQFLLEDKEQGLFLLCGNPAMTQYARVRLLTELDEALPPIVLVRILPREVQISQRAETASLLQAKDLAEWLVATLNCRILSPEGDDMTDRLDEEYAGVV